MEQFEFETPLDCSRDGLFNFLLRPANVALIADPREGLNIVNAPEIVELGSRIEFQLMGFGLVQSAVHEIIEFTRPERLVEQQVRGPLQSWRHEHLFERVGDGVRMIDRISFAPPAGVLRFIATPERIRSRLEDGFFARQQQLERLVRTGELT